MLSFTRKFGLIAVGLGLSLSIVACGVIGESSESSSSDISFGRPGRGRPPGQPVLADEDAAPPSPPQPSILASAAEDAAPPAPATDEDAGDAGEAPPVDPPMDPPPPAEDAGEPPAP